MAPKTSSSSLSRLLRGFIPLFLIAGLLPILIIGTTNTDTFSLFSRADSPTTLRVWIEPSHVIALKNKPVTLTIQADIDKPNIIVPSLSFSFTNDADITLSDKTLAYDKPFSGKINVGTITVTPKKSGTFTVSIPKEQLEHSNSSIEAVETNGVTITVK